MARREDQDGDTTKAWQSPGGVFARSTKPVIAIEMNHRLVRLTHELDWTELEEMRFERARMQRVGHRICGR